MIKEEYEDYFKNKRVTVMGLGLLGRGVGDTTFLADNESELIVTDKKTEEELKSSLVLLEEYKTITYHLGGHDTKDFEMRDFILKAAGVPHDSEYIEHAKKNNIPVYMSAALVSEIIRKQKIEATIIGITGTRGKSTVTQLVGHILKKAGLSVHLAGNIRGVANLPLLPLIQEGDIIVFELDSWQLQGFGDLNLSPHIAVFTNFLEDHMNYYKGDKEMYFNDKANIYRHQKTHDVLIASPQAASEIIMREKVAILIPEQNHFEMNIIGEHNQMAARLANEVALQCGLDEDEIREAIKTFPGVEGRLEDLGEYNGVHVFNDNNATTADATIAAVDAVNEAFGRKPFLIVGGSDKDLPLTLLEETILLGVKEPIFLAGTGTDKMNLPKKYLFETIGECLQKAFDLSVSGDVILFSPGFASFSSHFSNEYERNDAFIEALKKFVP